MFIIIWSFIIGFPLFHDVYVEVKSETPVINFFKTQSIDGKIFLIPEVLNRLVLEIKFKQGGDDENYLVEDLKVECECNSSSSRIERIFYVTVNKYDREVNEFFSDETRIEESYSELPLNSKYRDLSYTIKPQFALNGCEEFGLTIKASLVDTLSNNSIQIDTTFLVEENKVFQWERLRAH